MTVAGEVRLYMALQKAAHAFKKRADLALIETAGLTTAQAAVMAAIRNKSGATQRSVANALGLNESAVTAMIRKLMARKLIERRRSDRDARAWSLELSEEGEKLLAATGKPFGALNQALDESLGPDAIRQLSAKLDAITLALQEVNTEAG